MCKVSSGSVTSDGLIEVLVRGMPDEYSERFSYRNPQIEQVFPLYGPKAGGTTIELRGRHLRTGNAQQVLLDSLECDVTARTDSRFTCVTRSLSTVTVTPLSVHMLYDDGVRRFAPTTDTFTYRNNPLITQIQPLNVFLAGGRIITVTGSDLDVVQTPQMVMTRSGDSPLPPMVSFFFIQIINSEF